ncbi:hypothetical protein Y71_00915 [Kosakonia radicincitans DSM 16656]|nr:hypothetical protein Y71_00915 [Kosakonia radicincitans DSM 16656]
MFAVCLDERFPAQYSCRFYIARSGKQDPKCGPDRAYPVARKITQREKDQCAEDDKLNDIAD